MDNLNVYECSAYLIKETSKRQKRKTFLSITDFVNKNFEKNLRAIRYNATLTDFSKEYNLTSHQKTVLISTAAPPTPGKLK